MHTGLRFPNLCGATVMLAFALAAFGQVSAESYAKLVEARLKDMRGLSRLIGDASDNLVSANRKLSRQLPEDVKASAAWGEVEETQRRIDQGMQGFSKLLQTGVAADDGYLGGLDRAGAIATRAVEENLAVYAKLQRTMSQAIAAFMQLLEQQATASRALPESVRDLPDFRYVKRVRDATVDALDDAARVSRNRAAEYDSLLRSLRH
jgi:hypothetical protein